MKKAFVLLISFFLIVLFSNTLLSKGHERAKELYEFCGACHGDNGEGIQLLTSPRISIQDTWYIKKQLYKYREGIRGYNKVDPFSYQMKVMMLYLKETADVDQVADYSGAFEYMFDPSTDKMESEGIPGGDAEFGREIFQVCQGCHGPVGQGTESIGAPRLAGQGSWYIVQQLKAFKQGYRGIQPEDIGGQTMRPNALALEDEEDIYDVIGYISTLKPQAVIKQ